MAVGNQLARGSPSIRETKVIANVVEARLENLQHLLAGNTTALKSAFIHATELAFEQAVVVAELLLFNQSQTVIGVLAAGFRAMNAGTVIAAFQIFGGAENRNTETTADAN